MKVLFVLAAMLANSFGAYAGVGVPVLGMSVGDSREESLSKFRALAANQSFEISTAVESPSKRQAGFVFSRAGNGPIGHDRLAVIWDQPRANVVLIYREESFSENALPLQQVFAQSIAEKFRIVDIVRQHKFDRPLIWGETSNGPVAASKCFTDDLDLFAPINLYQVLYKARDRGQDATMKVFDPARIKMGRDGPACNVAYLLITYGRGGNSGDLVQNYQLTVMDLRLSARDFDADKARTANRASEEKQQAIKNSPKPSF